MNKDLLKLETDEDIAQRNIEELERLMHDDVYKLLRLKTHEAEDADELIRLNVLLEIRREQVKRTHEQATTAKAT